MEFATHHKRKKFCQNIICCNQYFRLAEKFISALVARICSVKHTKKPDVSKNKSLLVIVRCSIFPSKVGINLFIIGGVRISAVYRTNPTRKAFFGSAVFLVALWIRVKNFFVEQSYNGASFTLYLQWFKQSYLSVHINFSFNCR